MKGVIVSCFVTMLLMLGGCSQIEKVEPIKDEKIQEIDRASNIGDIDVVDNTVSDYMDFVSDVTTNLSESTSDLSMLFKSVGDKPSEIFKENFKEDLIGIYMVIIEDCKRIEGYENVPEGYEDIQRLLLESFEQYVESRDLILNAIQLKRLQYLDEATQLILDGNLKIKEVGNMMANMK